MVKNFFKDKNRQVIVFIAAALALSVFTYAAINVNNFTDYTPPSTLLVTWYDYYSNSNMTSPSSNNGETSWPRWSAEYPYRALFLGGEKSSSSYAEQSHNAYLYVIYSKKPVSESFTFEYIGGEKTTTNGKSGYIRARISQSEYVSSDDIRIVSGYQSSMPDGALDSGHVSFWSTYTTVGHLDGSKLYFDFDFYYECAGEHQQNAYTLNISGLRSIANVPYAYILKCDSHGSPGGSTSGSSSSGSSSSGSSSSGGSSSGGGNNKGDGGRHGWGDGEYGGGVNRDKINPQNDGGGYSDRDDMELSVPDDWKEPPEDNYNGGFNSEYEPDYPEYIPGVGDTGNNGENWELLGFDFDNDGVTGEINGYKPILPDASQNLIDFGSGSDTVWGNAEFIPDGEYGLIDFMKPYGG